MTGILLDGNQRESVAARCRKYGERLNLIT
jgi:hypothetical protein